MKNSILPLLNELITKQCALLPEVITQEHVKQSIEAFAYCAEHPKEILEGPPYIYIYHALVITQFWIQCGMPVIPPATPTITDTQ